MTLKSVVDKLSCQKPKTANIICHRVCPSRCIEEVHWHHKSQLLLISGLQCSNV